MAGYDPNAGLATDDSLFTSGLFGIDAAVGEAPVTLGYQQPVGMTGSPYAGPPAPSVSGLMGPPKPVAVTSKLIEAAQGFYQLPEDQVAELQSKLLSGGFYDDSYYTASGKTPQFGVADDDSYAAYRRAITRAARSGKAVPEILDEAIKSGAGEKAQTRQPLVVQLTSPTDLRKIYQAAAVALTGSRDMDEARVAKFVSDQQAAERQAQEALYTAGGSGLPGGPGGTVTQPPDPTAAAQELIRAEQPTATGGHDIAGTFKLFQQIIAGMGGGGGQ
jgi:hypothetical protein